MSGLLSFYPICKRSITLLDTQNLGRKRLGLTAFTRRSASNLIQRVRRPLALLCHHFASPYPGNLHSVKRFFRGKLKAISTGLMTICNRFLTSLIAIMNMVRNVPALADLFDYIGPFYNYRVYRSTRGYSSPEQFLKDWLIFQHETELTA